MAITLHELFVPVFVNKLKMLSFILKKGEAWAKENNVSEEDLINARLAPDMLPLSFQIQVCSNTSKSTLVRLAQTENVSMEDNEKTFDDLYKRIDATIDILEKADPKLFEGRETAEVTVRSGKGEIPMSGLQSLLVFSIPNFMFHAVTAYDILRHKGVPLGKLDYLRGGQ